MFKSHFGVANSADILDSLEELGTIVDVDVMLSVGKRDVVRELVGINSFESSSKLRCDCVVDPLRGNVFPRT